MSTDADQTFTICTPLLTGHDVGVGMALWCWSPKKLSPTAAVIDGDSSLNREHVERAKYRSNNACVGRRCGTLLPTGCISQPYK